jgi:hypothetical protein
MPAQALHTDGFVLEKRASAADGWQSFLIFAPEHGPLHVLQRLPGKTGGGRVLLDLFDEAALFLESSNQGRTWFLREAKILNRRPEIGRSYAVLREAAALTRLIARNSVAPDGRPAVTELLRTGLEAFARRDQPELIYFKCLYRFARDEGYPVRQAWLPSLPPADREAAALLLNQPLDRQTGLPEAVGRLREQLEDYLRRETEIRV